ncbi:MAG: MerR family transcriptional regulator [Mycobacterium leprae]
MAQLLKINDVSAQYGVSTRTLRYYEEIGLLWSEQPGPGQPRFYAPDAIRRLEQIIALRRLETPIQEIQRIFTMKDPAEAMEAFTAQLRALERTQRDMQVRRELLESLLAFFQMEQEEGASPASDVPEAIAALANRTVEQRRNGGWHPANVRRKRVLTNVRILPVEPMRMALYHDPVAPSCFDSWRHMVGWAKGYDLPTIRAFGHDSRNPEGMIPKYGYDVLFAIPDDFDVRGHLVSTQFPGGLYAITTTHYRDAAADWRALDRWVKQHPDYEPRSGLFLEELNVFSFQVTADSLVDLLYPIQPKEA